jgi:hypothetical protein
MPVDRESWEYFVAGFGSQMDLGLDIAAKM